MEVLRSVACNYDTLKAEVATVPLVLRAMSGVPFFRELNTEDAVGFKKSVEFSIR